MRVLDLFSGIGGFSLGLERAGMRTVAFCESEPYAQAVLRKHWPDVPVYPDVRTIPTLGGIDLICGGFPCQPFSGAGKQLGAEDDRHLWPAMLEVIRRERPAWVIGENVAGIVRMGLDPVLSDLEELCYASRTFVIPAVAVDAPHKRDRVWIVAHAECERGCSRDGQGEYAVDADPRSESQRGSHEGWWAEPGMGRVAYGVPKRAHRLRCLGNAVVPQIPEIIGRAIMASEIGVDNASGLG